MVPVYCYHRDIYCGDEKVSQQNKEIKPDVKCVYLERSNKIKKQGG